MSTRLHMPSIERQLRLSLRLRQIEDELVLLGAIELASLKATEHGYQDVIRQLQEARRAATQTITSQACPDTSKQHRKWKNVFHNLGPNLDRDSDCSICQCEISADDEVLRHAECDNCFHSKCLVNWTDHFDADGKTPTCPMCRKEFIKAHTEVDTAIVPSEYLAHFYARSSTSESVRNSFSDIAGRLGQEKAAKIAEYLRRSDIENETQIQDWMYENLAARFDCVVDYDLLMQRLNHLEQRYQEQLYQELRYQELRYQELRYQELRYYGRHSRR